MSAIFTAVQAAQAAQAAQTASDATQSADAASAQAHARKRKETSSLSTSIRVLLFFAINGLVAFGAVSMILVGKVLVGPVLWFIGFVASILIIRMVHVVAEWERGVVLRLGKFIGVRGPGLILIFPVIDYLKVIDTRVQTLEIPRQRVITRDNVPVSINGVLYFKVVEVGAALIKIQDYEYGIMQYAMAALRDVIGRLSLDDLLSERDQIQKEIEHSIEKNAEEWGLEVDSVRLQDIDMPEELKRMMSRQASAEREKRATITKAEGDKLAALNLSEAAATMLASPGAMQLRTLQTLDGLGSSAANTIVLAVPTDLFTLANRVSAKLAPAAEPTPVDIAPPDGE